MHRETEIPCEKASPHEAGGVVDLAFSAESASRGFLSGRGEGLNVVEGESPKADEGEAPDVVEREAPPKMLRLELLLMLGVPNLGISAGWPVPL